MKSVDCFLCQAPLKVKETKKGKPYLTCEDCGVQIFVRYQTGMDRLERLSSRRATLAGDYVICKSCDVAIHRTAEKIGKPLFGRAGWYCPECGELLMEAKQA